MSSQDNKNFLPARLIDHPAKSSRDHISWCENLEICNVNPPSFYKGIHLFPPTFQNFLKRSAEAEKKMHSCEYRFLNESQLFPISASLLLFCELAHCRIWCLLCATLPPNCPPYALEVFLLGNVWGRFKWNVLNRFRVFETRLIRG